MVFEDFKAAVGRFEATHQAIADFRWPDGVRVAVNFTVDFDAMLFRRVLNEPRMQLVSGEFGGRVGVWRLLELFSDQCIPATFFVPGRIAELYPDALQAIVTAGHELADHMWEHRIPETTEAQRAHIDRSFDALARFAGRRPYGSRSRNTTDLLVAAGAAYQSEMSPAPLPHFIRSTNASPAMVNLPFHLAIDDAQFFTFAWMGTTNAAQRIVDPERVMDIWWDAFVQKYREGGYLAIAMHPEVSGRAGRCDALARLIARMKELPGVWFATCEEVARHTLAGHAPPDTWARPVTGS